MKRSAFFTWSLLFLLFVAGECRATILHAAGATFPYPLYSAWFAAYENQTGERISYEPVGSGRGIRELERHGVDFAATDAFMSDEDLDAAPAPIVHIPTCVGAVAIVYNIPGNPKIRLTPRLVSRIFAGRITRWDDPEISRASGRRDMPGIDITVVHRSDASGTTFVFSRYLSEVSALWAGEVGWGKKVPWPTGVGVDKNSGVAEFVRRIPGSIGYVALPYAATEGLPVAAVRNSAGIFVEPSTTAVTAAAQVSVSHDTRMMLTNTEARDGYPLSTFTYLVLYREQGYGGRPLAKAEALVRFLRWVLSEGQAFAEKFAFAPLPENARKAADAVIRSLTYHGQPVPSSP